ncbi:hypothetical protein L1D31_05915 [Vibrio sp. Isolate23]|uniref:hypothetical protein n=1 Tax=Vibrio sp. Isolate23 TaxID=2908533 RepID=UPI001EFD90B7|nr:hypothetical protein [Vibrio sp. Isolate23]MCG9682101.1 hypothetical protein [Vibrio sp. Isolate23]
MNRSGFIFILLSILLSISSALEINGTWVEQTLGFASQLFTFLLLIALFGVWQGKKLFSESNLKLIAFSYPILLLIVPVYQYFEYSEQTMPWSYIYMQLLEFLFSLVVASILVKENK